MGKTQKKTGKGRIDKYYKLAKEQGYRARSAFKLIQLNKKYNFLESAKCCIDLCAAPGGWLQVASKYMPMNSIIVGVDLVPIKLIPRVSTFACDITTPQCRTFLRGELKDWKADVVLHDGAPNVGSAWIQDAYAQSELVLMSLKLAVEFLIKGGTFVTKVFRSQDYNNLLWVFNQLFGKVEATKPPSSRNVSAEIFVVCRDFLAPKHIDPKFLDPRHVFKELTATGSISGTTLDKGTSANNAHANVFMPEKKRRRREGYDEGDYTLYKTLPAVDFVKSHDPIALLGNSNKITFTTEEEKHWLKTQTTKDDIKANCEDLKVLGKGDFKALMKWRTLVREEIGLDVKEKPTEELTETVEIDEGEDEEEQIEAELERLNTEAAARAKREKRRANEQKQRTIQRMQLQMTAPIDIGQELEDHTLRTGQEDIFDLGVAEKKRNNVLTLDEEPESVDEEGEEADASSWETEGGDGALDSEDERERHIGALEDDLDGMYDAYMTMRSERDTKFKVKEARKKNADREETWGGIKPKAQDSDDSQSEDGSESEVGGWEEMQAAKAQDSTSNISDDSGDEEPLPHTGKKRKDLPDDDGQGESRPLKRVKTLGRLLTNLSDPTPKSQAQLSRSTQLWFSQDVFAGLGNMEVDDEDPGEDTYVSTPPQQAQKQQKDQKGSTPGGDDFEVVPAAVSDDNVDMWDAENNNEDEIKQAHIRKFGLLTPEAVTLAQRLVNRQTTKTHLINEGFTRYSLDSKEGLPNWFLDDEAKHYKANLPITKEAVRALREKQRALDARPIKKVAEAKARKKVKAAQRFEKAMKKAEGVNQTADMTEREKASQIEKLMKKGMSKGKKKTDIKVVVAKGPNKGIKGRPKGVKGRYKIVDARMRKEVRAEKRRAKETKKHRK